jgi:site-specific recombinase XerD
MTKQMDKETLRLLLERGVISQADYDNLLGNTDEKTIVLSNNTIIGVVRQFEGYLRDEFSHNTAEGYGTNVRKFVEYVCGVEDLGDIKSEIEMPEFGRDVVEKWFYSLASRGYTYSSIRRFKHSLKKFFEFLHQEYEVAMPAIDDIELPNIDTGIADIDALPDQEVREIAEHATNLRNKVVILFLYETGMRRQELIDCLKEHVNFDARHVDIYSNGKHDRVGAFSQETHDLLVEYLREWEYEVDEVNSKRKQRSVSDSVRFTPVVDSPYLFQTVRSPQISYSTIFKAIKDASFEFYLNKAGADGCPEEEAKSIAEERSNKINTETLRQSRRAFWFSKGKTLEQVQAIMGDENKWVCKRYLKIAQKLYPKQFFG